MAFHRNFSKANLFPSLSSLLLAGLLAGAGVSALAQGAPTATQGNGATTAAPGMHGGHMGGHMGGRMGRQDPAKHQAMVAKHQADMKAALKITPAQEGAWSTYTAAMQPSAGMRGRMMSPEQRAEMDKLSTPERIDKMRNLRTQHMAERSAVMEKRGDATKALYAALMPEQKKVFDMAHKNRRVPHGKGGQDRQGGFGDLKS